jgi:hypothetical protein
MLQMFYLDVAKVDLDVAYTCMLQAYVLSVFRCFIRMFVNVSSHVAYICNGIQMFFMRFHKYLRRLFKRFICLLLHVAATVS